MDENPLILLTGATGYIGGRLLSALEGSGHRVRCMARNPEYLRSRASSGTELVRGDVLEAGSLESALQGVHAAYYLIHSMGSGQDFERQDREGAQNFGAAARATGVRRIIYLGGLGERTEEDLSSHLRSRHETGAVLRGSGVPVIELRTSIVLGSGSLSYELIRALVERLPIMICPRWVRVETQPIAIEDVIAYLVASLDLQGNESRVYEVGGADQVSYSDIMLEYARQRGLRRLLIPVPLLTPYLSSLWLGLTTPLYARVGRKLIESVRNPTVVRDEAALDAFPDIRPMGLTSAIARARRNEDREIAATRGSDALSSSGSQTSWGGVRFGTRLVDSRRLHVEASPARAFTPIRRIGGTTGWYTVNWLWRLRGFLDLLVGGVGMRRGRRDPEHLAVGDALDFWRVEEFEPDRSLRLRAEMKVPGRAWLEFEVEPDGSGSVIRQTAIFDPAGLGGLVYWYGIYPLHVQVFKGMLRGIGRMVE
ncbi:MAG: SDR family oxidoreductase [Acidobacteriota bacterium]